ncbi:MAG: ABC transporter permease [Candidatus Kerfeldbacteria bacterium]|nr:ABC transporter permease [Candidatus Kerfeldbacteria bacterium]
MNFVSIFQLSLKNLRANPLRSFLTMLGLIIGIGSVVLIMSVGAGAQVLVLSQVNKIGSDLIGVLPGASDAKGPPASVFGIQVKTLINDDIKALQDSAGSLHLKAVAGYAQGQAKMVYEDRVVEGGSFMGVSATYPQVENVTLAQGGFFTPADDDGLARVAVLGSEIAKEFFDSDNPMGKTIKIKRENFKVVGVLEPRGTVAFANQDKMVLMPLLTAQKVMLGWRHLSLIRAKVDNAIFVDSAIDGVKQLLRAQHKIDSTADDDFSVRAAAQAIDMLKTITSAFSFFLAAIAAISLLVGGIGIMNIMLVAVTERYREIGLRKAVGATSAHVLKQFLLETIMITILGSVIGIVGGAIISWFISIVVKYLEYDWAFIVSPASVIVAVAVGTFIGLIFGYYPARRAAKLDPIEALRYE